MGSSAKVEYDCRIMPSWNVHTAIVERLLAGRNISALGIEDANTFLFGNYVPDIYVGFMVPDASWHIDYCITHLAKIELIPVPNSDLFWDYYVGRRKPASAAGVDLVVGAWAHLVADRFYNERFRTFLLAHDVPEGEALRKAKQGDFDTFGRSLGVTSLVEATPSLVDAAWDFKPYRLLPDDIARAVEVANAIVRESRPASEARGRSIANYQILDEKWMRTILDDCVEYLLVWLETWQRFEGAGRRCLAADIRAVAAAGSGLPGLDSMSFGLEQEARLAGRGVERVSRESSSRSTSAGLAGRS